MYNYQEVYLIDGKRYVYTGESLGYEFMELETRQKVKFDQVEAEKHVTKASSNPKPEVKLEPNQEQPPQPDQTVAQETIIQQPTRKPSK